MDSKGAFQLSPDDEVYFNIIVVSGLNVIAIQVSKERNRVKLYKSYNEVGEIRTIEFTCFNENIMKYLRDLGAKKTIWTYSEFMGYIEKTGYKIDLNQRVTKVIS